MRYDAKTRTLHLERKNCTNCDFYEPVGHNCGYMDCPKCKGTGNGPRGGKGKCQQCYGRRIVPDHDNPVLCRKCGGDYIDADEENRCDNAPDGILYELPWAVVRQNRAQSFAEAYLGTGLYSATDYGTAWNADDDIALIQKVLEEERRVQAVKITEKTDDPKVLRLADGMVIIVTPNGYSPMAYTGDMDAVCAKAAAHLPAEQAMMLGSMYHAATGGNGTALAAIL